ncbi:hypothetical protein G4B88_025223, partial [Cannabis sativa]
MLETKGELRSSKYTCVDKKVAMFLHIIAHQMKNRVIKFEFMRFGQTISKNFHNNCLGTLDGTYIRVRVPNSDKPMCKSPK